MATASGTFDVRIEPVEHDQAGIGRMSLSQTWHGGLSGTGAGREGGFAFQQFGTMDAGGQQLTYAIVPGSGTGDLAGITGTLDLTIVDGEHRYVLTYAQA